ncbi:hypothetical protein AAF712_004877 [Marasmius tenuissimus]|uniref:Uncharacterized protein n=1 Tax=Marasmius tenuissimus TaxID=585030 RepID=A0ABR3A4Q0_9AGAR
MQESFSGMLDKDALNAAEERGLADMSFNVEQITDIQEIVPEWDDEEVDEIVVLSPKMPNRLSTIMEDLQELDKNANVCGLPDPSD